MANKNILLSNIRVFDETSNKRQKDCLWKQRAHYGLENGSLHKQ